MERRTLLGKVKYSLENKINWNGFKIKIKKEIKKGRVQWEAFRK